jgi:hypothetical protein
MLRATRRSASYSRPSNADISANAQARQPDSERIARLQLLEDIAASMGRAPGITDVVVLQSIPPQRIAGRQSHISTHRTGDG